MLDRKDHATIEMGVAGAAIAAGYFLLQLPPNWWPNMAPILVHIGVSMGLALLTCGALLFIVGASRWTKTHRWQDSLVERWDKMRNARYFYLKFAAGFVLFVAFATFVWGAFAQDHTSNGPVTVDDRSKCPKDSIILDSNIFLQNGTAVKAPPNTKICLVNNRLERNNTGLDFSK